MGCNRNLFRICGTNDLGNKTRYGYKNVNSLGRKGAHVDVTGRELLSSYNWARLCANCLSLFIHSLSYSGVVETVRGSRWMRGYSSAPVKSLSVEWWDTYSKCHHLHVEFWILLFLQLYIIITFLKSFAFLLLKKKIQKRQYSCYINHVLCP